MLTMVEFDRVSAEDSTLFVFRAIGSNEEFFVYDFRDGIATVYYEDDNLSRVSTQTIAGCFADESNFASELCKIFLDEKGQAVTDKLKAIHLKICYGGMTIEIKKHNG